MTLLDDKELTKIANNEFVLEFLNAKLVQQSSDHPDIYSGSGSISQSSDGDLQLKMYCPFKSSEDLGKELQALGKGSGLEPGQLVETEHHFTFEGLDVFGQVWKASDLWLGGDVSFPAAGRIVRSEVRSLENRRERSEGSTNVGRKLLVVPGSYKIPFTRGQPGTLEPGFSACTIDLGGGRTCEMKTRGTTLVLIIALQDSDPESYSGRLLEAIGICLGAHLVPQVEVTTAGKERIQVVRRLDKDASKHDRIQPPIPMNHPDALPGLQDFVRRYMTRVKQPSSQLAGNWFRTLVAFDGGLENQALVLTTVIEGLLKAYFPDQGKPDDEFLKQILEAMPVVKSLAVGSRARARILSSLGNAKAPTPSNALTALSKVGKIPPELMQVWKTLRNKASHADELKLGVKETQAFIDDLYACLELFYRLVMLHIGYEGRLNRYSKLGWPEQGVDDFS